MRARFIPFALIVALSLAACSGSGHDSGKPPSTPPGTSVPTSPPTSPPPGSTSVVHSGPPPASVPPLPADVPTTGPNLLRKGEKPPLMPLEATQHTQAGATAFAQFFIHTIDWAYATTSTSYMKHYFTSACVTCKSIQAGIDDAKAKGRHFIGDRLTITRVSEVAKSSGAAAAAFVMTVAFDVTSGEVVDSAGVFVDALPALELRNRLEVHWLDEAWSIVDVEVLK